MKQIILLALVALLGSWGVAGAEEPGRAKVLIVTGDNHPAHDWRAVTKALKEELEKQPGVVVEVTEKPEELGTRKLGEYAVVVLNYCNWNQAGLSEGAKEKLVGYVKGGGGLSVIHFANGAFHPSLPNTGASDWPEYRKLVRRVWDGKGGSGHDAYGPLRVEITGVKHVITEGLVGFDSVDELYFNQAGSEPIEALATAKSKVTGKDEPMAWAYGYGEGRVFQTVLGHSAESVMKAGQLMRRGTLWAAGKLGDGAARASKPPKAVKVFSEADWVDDRFSRMDTGPFFSGSVSLPGGMVPKGVAVKLDGGKAGMLFDTELLTWRAAWTGGFMKIDPARFGLIGSPKPAGELVFQGKAQLGWSGSDGAFNDPRQAPYGPLAKELGRFQGLHLHGDRVVLGYSVDEARVWESVSYREVGGRGVFIRDMKVGPHERELRFDRAILPPTREVRYLRVLTSGKGDSLHGEVVDGDAKEFEGWLAPGGLRWGEPLVTKGSVGEARDGFAFDTITMPYDNPWKALMFASGHDFFSNGDAAVCTIHGDVWLVSGVDEDLGELKWKRFATGLYQPLGLRVVKEKVYVLGRDQITILNDLNGDGEADFYECFNNEGQVSGGGHEYVTSLEMDGSGNFYYTKGAGPIAHGGSVLRIPADGKGIEVFATGFRYPNGLGMGPDGTVTVADQQGEWVPSTRLDVVAPESFHGYMPMHHRQIAPEGYDGPLCWIPHGIDNSAGGQVWVPPGAKWGPLAGQLLHFSYGKCTMMLVLRDEVEGLTQGATVPLPGRFLGGAMRGRFSTRDGHLYVTGSSGWQTAAIKDGCFQRVRYTGEDSCLPTAFQVHQDGLRITFSQPLDKSVAEDVGSYAVERWNYRWAATYGSKDWSVTSPDTEGHDTMKVESARLAEDGRTVFLKVSDMRPAMQMKVQYDLDTAEGGPVRGAMYPTIHRLHKP